MQKKDDITRGMKYRFSQNCCVRLLHLHLLFEKAKLTNYSTNEPEILHVNRFSSKLVHRHIICSLTLLLLAKQLIMGPDNTL